MLNNYSSSSSDAIANANVENSINVKGEINNFHSIDRISDTTLFKKIDIDSIDIETMFNDNPFIIKNSIYRNKLIDSLKYTNNYYRKFYCNYDLIVQPIKVMSIQQVSSNSLIIQYENVGESFQLDIKCCIDETLMMCVLMAYDKEIEKSQ